MIVMMMFRGEKESGGSPRQGGGAFIGVSPAAPVAPGRRQGQHDAPSCTTAKGGSGRCQDIQVTSGDQEIRALKAITYRTAPYSLSISMCSVDQSASSLCLYPGSAVLITRKYD